MRRLVLSGCLFQIMSLFDGSAFAAVSQSVVPSSHAPGLLSNFFNQLILYVSGNWPKYGQVFTHLQAHIFGWVFLGVLVLVPAVYLLHLLIVGAKKFSHDGPEILYFRIGIRIIHLVAAVSFSLLVLTGLMMVFGLFLGGGLPVRIGRYVHIYAAIVFAIDALLMFVLWVKDMLPRAYDISWALMIGGYLSKEKKPVPAGKFNAGQKVWFWLATAGGGVMAYTGYYMHNFEAATDTLRIFAIIHNFLATFMIAFFLTHLYMSIFAVKGSLRSMLTGYKPKEEVDIMHSLYRYE